nr:NAD(P)/FAD-dependent oxidoreductase [Knoellia subterranea]
MSKLNAANHSMLEGQATLLDGHARFTGPKEVTVETRDGDVVVTAENIIIGTGTSPTRPNLPGIDLDGVHDSTTIQHIDPFPKRLAVIGGGFIGLEFANMFRLFGSDVTVLDASETFLEKAEPIVAQTAHDLLVRGGVEIRNGVKVAGIEKSADGIQVLVDGSDAKVEADAVLVAVGRTPATSDLGLDKAGIETNERGFITVDDHLRTNVDGVFAVGDVNGGPQFTYISLDDNRIVWDQLMGKGERTTSDRIALPHNTFITPPLSSVGMSPAEAVAAGHTVLYAAKPVAKLAAMPRPKIVGDAEGVITFTVDAGTREVLGASLFCIDSQELVNLVALAMRAGVTADELMNGIWTHPSSTEAFNEVLAELAHWTPED